MLNFVTLLRQLACDMSDVFRGLAFVHKHGVPGLRSVGDGVVPNRILVISS